MLQHLISNSTRGSDPRGLTALEISLSGIRSGVFGVLMRNAISAPARPGVNTGVRHQSHQAPGTVRKFHFSRAAGAYNTLP